MFLSRYKRVSVFVAIDGDDSDDDYDDGERFERK